MNIASDSATQAGFSCPSISIVWVVVKRIRPGSFSSTPEITILERILDPTRTGAMKRTLFKP